MVVTPGFVSDCLETLEEIREEVRDLYLSHGGEKFSHVPCLNDSEPGMGLIETIAARELSGWV